jgi:hypothetical protein
MSEPPSVEELDALPTDELRRRAFDLAESQRDVAFFWDVVKHLRASGDIAAEDASSGNITGSIAEAVEVIHNMTSGDLGEFEPLLRARFIGYIREHA